MNTSTFGARSRARLSELRDLRSERGATDPILIIAGIAITLILLVGGSFAVAGFMNNARDLNAKADLDRIATVQAKNAATNGLIPKEYLLYAAGTILTPAVNAGVLGQVGVRGDDETDFGAILSDGVEAVVIPAFVPGTATGPNGEGADRMWFAYARSATGTWFMRTSLYQGTFEFGNIDNLQIPENLVGKKFGTETVTDDEANSGLIADIRSLNDSLTQLEEQFG